MIVSGIFIGIGLGIIISIPMNWLWNKIELNKYNKEWKNDKLHIAFNSVDDHNFRLKCIEQILEIKLKKQAEKYCELREKISKFR